MQNCNAGAFIVLMQDWNTSRLPVRITQTNASLLLESCPSTAATTAATPLNSAEQRRTNLDNRPMNCWQIELQRTMLNGPGAHGMQGVRGSNPRTSTK
jgi:hypothetical protein